MSALPQKQTLPSAVAMSALAKSGHWSALTRCENLKIMPLRARAAALR